MGRMNRSRAAAVRLPARQGVLPQVAPEQPQPAIRRHLLEDKLGGQLPLDQLVGGSLFSRRIRAAPCGGRLLF